MINCADFEMQVVDEDFARCFAPSGVGQSLHLLAPTMQVRIRTTAIAAPRGRAAKFCESYMKDELPRTSMLNFS